MKFLLAPNAMKGALSSRKIAAILSKTIRRKYPDAEILSFPIADGGNGTLECLMDALGGTVYEQEVTGPISSMRVNARYGITKEGTAVIESAEAVGLHLLAPSPETIAQSTTLGVGELLRTIMEQKCSRILIGLGGTATNDGGAGMMRGLGFELLDQQGEPLRDGSIPLINIHSIIPYSRATVDCPITILTDVQNPLLGPNGATAVFARQKGASEDQLPYLESALKNFSEIVSRTLHSNHTETPGSGAAGGLAFGLMSASSAEIVSGIEFILDTVGFNDALASCDCVITTEGTLDAQTLSGKGIAGIARRARAMRKPVHAFAGRVLGDQAALPAALGLASLTQVSPDELTTQQAMRDASWLLADAVFHFHF
jgi:glycerate kinase